MITLLRPPPSPEALSLLKSSAFFSSCNQDQLAIIAADSLFQNYESKEIVFSAGDPSAKLYIVAEGEVLIVKSPHNEKSTPLARFLNPDCFGELEMITGESRSATALVERPSRLLVFPKGKTSFQKILGHHPAVSAHLLNTFLVQISSRTRNANTLVKQNSPLVEELKRQVYVDKTTGLYNQTFLKETLDRLLANRPCSVGLLMCKPDNFKYINDQFGHEAGDQVLRLIADTLGKFFPDRENLFRFMGNENALILRQTDRNGLEQKAREVKNLLSSLDLNTLAGANRLSVSIGMALAPEHGKTAKELIAAAHPLTLLGRKRGGNRCLFPEDKNEV